MKLEHDFEVAAELRDAWPLLLDLERIAPCMPGAQLQEVDGDEYRGIVKVKVGPITAQYRGAARVVEADEAARKVVLRAEGRDTRGQGNAAADIVATLTAEGSRTRVHVDTDLNVTGKVAQFGRGVMADVSAKLMDQFVTCLSTTVLSGDGGDPAPDPTPSPAAPTAAAPAASDEAVGGGEVPAPSTPAAAPSTSPPSGPRHIDAPEAEAVDLVRAAGGAVAKRVVPLVAVAVVVVGVVVWLLVR
jgi:carbon monoxide dehydrogenase subunit G